MKHIIKKSSSRNQIRIKEVRDGILILPGNKYRMIIATSSINFELKSEEEQDAIIESFQNFLNSLPCSIQILVKVREIDIQGYIENFIKENNHEKEKVYKDQLKNYSVFIKELVAGNKIMTRQFYIVVPYRPIDGKNDFSLISEQLKLSTDIISKGLEKLGMKTHCLGNLEILNLFYSVYNNNHLKTQPLSQESFVALFGGQNAI